MPAFCYVLSGVERGHFAAMAYLSISALRRVYPGADVSLLVDPETELVLRRRGLPVLGEASRVVTVPVQADRPEVRSRELKTRMRSVLRGDLVFLDADTLALRPFDELFAPGPVAAAVLDRNRDNPRPAFPDWVRPLYDRMDWKAPLARYFNSGVLFLPDRPETRALAEEWERRWRGLYEATRKFNDQPALNSSLDALGTDVRVMPPAFNAMVEAWPYAVRGARILHFFADGMRPGEDSLLGHMLRRFEETGSIDWAALDRARERDDPWMAAGRSVQRELATRHYLRAAKLAFRRLARRAGLDPVSRLAGCVFVCSSGMGSSFLSKRLRKAGAPFVEKPFINAFFPPGWPPEIRRLSERPAVEDLTRPPSEAVVASFRRAQQRWSNFSQRFDFDPRMSVEENMRAYLDFLKDCGASCVLRATSVAGLLSTWGVRGAVFLIRRPFDAYASYAAPDRHGDQLDAIGGMESSEAIAFFAWSWNAAVGEYLACRAAGLEPVLVRYERAEEDAAASGAPGLRAMFEGFEPRRVRQLLSARGQEGLERLVGVRQSLLYGDGAGENRGVRGGGAKP